MITYLFYLKPSKDCEISFTTLYAYTTNKKYAEDFREQRNAERFHFVKKKSTKEEFTEFEKKHSKLRLTYGKFYTRSDIFGKRTPIQILCTWMEEESIIKNSDRLWEEFEKDLFDCKIYKSEYIQALEKLLFIQFYGFYKVKYLEYADSFYQPYYSSFGPVEGLIMEEYRNSFSYDDLKLFLKFFKNTFDV
jgi:hypothetical protein